MARFILDVNEEWGVTVILIEHDMGVVMDISDRVAVLDMGQKIADGTPDEVRANPRVIKAYLGETEETTTDVRRFPWLRARSPDCCSATRATSTTGRRSARRIAASGRPGRGASTTTRSATSRSAWPRSASSAANGSRSSATTGRGSTGPRSPPSALGGVPVPVYQDSIAKELAFVWNHAECAVIVAEDQEQVDKVLGLRAELPALRLVVYDDSRGMLHYKQHDWLRSYQSVQELGREFAAKNPGYFEAEIEKGKPEDVAIICYTSGTTGNPKGVMLTHANAIAIADAFRKADDVRPEDDALAYLPMAWAGDAAYTLFLSLVVGFCANCPESPETVQRDLRELGPDDRAGAAAHLGKHADAASR